MRKLLLILFLALGPPLIGQVVYGPFTATAANAVTNPNGSVTTCAQVDISGAGSVGITVNGTFSITFTPKVAIGGQADGATKVVPAGSTSSSTQSTITTAGNYKLLDVSNWTLFELCPTSYSSGTATIYIKTSPIISASLFGSGSTSSGTVTSVTFTGDGIVDSSTPSTAVTTSGTVTATALTQTANTVLAGPTTGSAAAPAFRALTSADLPSGVGTVTSASVTTANGVSATVATQTTTPAFTFTLGAITPTTVNGLTFAALTTGFSIAGGTTSKTLTINNTLGFSGTDSTTFTFPGTSDTVVTLAATQTLTNKTFGSPVVTTLLTLPVGTTTAPSEQATGSASNTGFVLTTGVGCWLAAGSLTSCGTSNGQIVGDAGDIGFSQSNQGNGSVGAIFTVAGSSTTEYLKSSTPLIQSGQCKITNAGISLTAAQTTICQWTLPNSSQTLSWLCQGTYSTTTTAIGLTLGIAFSASPTNAVGNAIIYTGLAGTSTAGSSSNVSSTTPTNMLVGGSIASATSNVPWLSSGTMTSGASSGTFTIYGTPSTNSDVTIGASTCTLY
jgi:hypothetical protein